MKRHAEDPVAETSHLNSLDASTDNTSGQGISRRKFLETAVGAGAACALAGFPAVHAKGKVVLRYVVSGVCDFREIADQAKQDLGITVKLERASTIQANMLRAIMRPKTLDILDLDYGHIRSLSRMGMLKPIETKRIQWVDKLSPIFTEGVLAGRELSSQGGAPFLTTFLQSPSGTKFASGPSDWMTVVPTVYNADTLGIRPDLVDRPISHWKDLLDPEFKGRTAIMNIPSIGILDAAMAIESAGLLTYRDKGNMTREEIDKTIGILIAAKIDGQFHSLWSDFLDSVELMASGKVVIQSMWSPAVTQVKQQGIPCVYQPLQEGYRGWCYGIGMSRALDGYKLDAAYEFVNWYLSGWTGAFLNRQGYYPSVLSTAREFSEPYEWDYWMLGQPAAKVIKSPRGIVIEQKGNVRDGGSFEKRMSHIACWNSMMDEGRYLLERWQNFVDT